MHTDARLVDDETIKARNRMRGFDIHAGATHIPRLRFGLLFNATRRRVREVEQTAAISAALARLSELEGWVEQTAANPGAFGRVSDVAETTDWARHRQQSASPTGPSCGLDSPCVKSAFSPRILARAWRRVPGRSQPRAAPTDAFGLVARP
jgi:hypothetical protein